MTYTKIPNIFLLALCLLFAELSKGTTDFDSTGNDNGRMLDLMKFVMEAKEARQDSAKHARDAQNSSFTASESIRGARETISSFATQKTSSINLQVQSGLRQLERANDSSRYAAKEVTRTAKEATESVRSTARTAHQESNELLSKHLGTTRKNFQDVSNALNVRANDIKDGLSDQQKSISDELTKTERSINSNIASNLDRAQKTLETRREAIVGDHKKQIAGHAAQEMKTLEAVGDRINAEQIRLDAEKTKEAREKQRLDREADREAAIESARVKARIENSKDAIDAKGGVELKKIDAYSRNVKNILSDKKVVTYTVVAAAVVIGSYFIFKHGVPIIASQIEKYLQKPRLVKETNVLAWHQRLLGKNVPTDKYTFDNLHLEGDLQSQLTDLADSTKEAQKLGLGYNHSMFYGPPGTGKTFAAKILSHYSKLPWVVIAGSSFDQFEEKEALKELDNIFIWANKIKGGAIVFVDEADSFLARREGKNLKNDKLVNMFLSHVETATHDKLMFVFATNHLDRIDSAIRSRISHLVKFDLPNKEGRFMQLKINMKNHIFEKGFSVKDYNKDILMSYAEKSEGFSGRSLDTLVKQWQTFATLKNNPILEEKDMDIIFRRFMKRVQTEATLLGN
ncbi:MAG: AAA family ATPase [Oligoflexales bacterium]